MPTPRPATWRDVEAGQLIQGAAGPRRVTGRPNPGAAILDGQQLIFVHPDQLAVVLEPTMAEAFAIILSVFPQAEILESTEWH